MPEQASLKIQIDDLPQIIDGIRLDSASAEVCYKDRKDVVLIELNPQTTTAAVFTTNAFCAAPVQIAKKHLLESSPRYLLINSGNANAGTGQPGYEAAMACCKAVAEHTGCQPNEVLPFSTGVIGQVLPSDRVMAVIPSLVSGLDPKYWSLAAEAIMTTDTRSKLFSCQTSIDGKLVHFTGIAKGSGMIRPNMATMLSYVATDANIGQSQLQTCLNIAVNKSFNRITVDGDTSTNDALVLMATGKSGVEITDNNIEAFQAALNELCITLARSLVRDGEGATKLINIEVQGGQNEQECARVAYAIAHSPLVKTAFFASDPNWGRILAAVGYAGVKDLDIDKLQIYLDEVCLVEQGGVAKTYTEEQGQKVMQQAEITVRVNLNRGDASTTVWTCDFSYDYVRINAEYRT